MNKEVLAELGGASKGGRAAGPRRWHKKLGFGSVSLGTGGAAGIFGFSKGEEKRHGVELKKTSVMRIEGKEVRGGREKSVCPPREDSRVT